VFSPTEASAVAVMYGLFVAAVVYRDLRLASLPVIFRETIEISAWFFWFLQWARS